MSFKDYALRGYDETSGILESDWYNAQVELLRLSSETLGNGLIQIEEGDFSLMRWYEYTLTLEPGQTLKNAVTAPLYPAIDAGYTPSLYSYTYLLSPAKTWAQFGELEVVVKTPYYMTESGIDGFTKTDGGYALTLPGLPENELTFTLSESEKPQPPKWSSLYIMPTEFIIVLNHPLSEQEEHEYKAYLESIGDSIVVVADDEIVKTHVHTNDPGLAIQKALTHGSLSKIKIDNMREEHQEKLIKDAEKLAEKQKEEEEAAPKADEPRKDMGFISVSIGEGMNEIFRGLGVDYIIEGGQTMNPSTEDMLSAIDHVNADHIFILPNNKNIIMAANQAASLVEDKEIIVLPTKTIPQGIVAMVNYIPDYSAEENKETMLSEIDNVKTGQVTYAVRDTEIDGKVIKQNDFMGIGDKEILSVGTDLKATTLEMIDAMVDEDSAIVSIYYGTESNEADAEAIGAVIGAKYPDVEIEVNNGGQPIYYYVISVE